MVRFYCIICPKYLPVIIVSFFYIFSFLGGGGAVFGLFVNSEERRRVKGSQGTLEFDVAKLVLRQPYFLHFQTEGKKFEDY